MTRPRSEVLVAALCAALAHALVLGGLHPAGPPAAAGRMSAPLLVRMLSIAPGAEPEASLAGEVGPERSAALPSRQPSHAVVNEIASPGGTHPTQEVAAPRHPRAAPRGPDRSDHERLPALPPAAERQAVPAANVIPSGADYLLGAELDPRPTLLEGVEPVFPAEAGLQEGMVVLRVLINEAGGVDDVAVIRSSPPGLFERSAVAAFRGARFSPGMVLGRPVKSQISVQMDFTPFNRGAAVSGRGY